MNSIIDLKNISKAYNDRIKSLRSALFNSKKLFHGGEYALRNINLTFYSGEVIGIIGDNGAGKTTLLKIICGVLKATQGEVHIYGKVASLLELGSGFNPNFTGRENSYLYASILGISKDAFRSKIHDIISFSGLEAVFDKPIRTYSSGMVARLAFSVATEVNPEILIIDEALSVGDARFRTKSFSRIKQLKESGITIIFCSHSLYQVELLSNRVLWLEEGKIKYFGEAKKAVAGYRDANTCKILDKFSKHTTCKENYGFLEKINIYKNNLPYNPKKPFTSEKDSLTIEVDYRVTDKHHSPSIAISFSLEKGPIICGIGSFQQGFVPIVKEGKGSISLLIKKVNLLKGTYFVNVNLMNADGTVCLDAVRDCIKIKVIQESLAQGYFTLDHEWLT